MYEKKAEFYLIFLPRQESNESSSVSEEEDLEEDDDPESDDEDEDDEHEIPTLPTFHHMRSRRINLDNLKLPETCTVLTTNRGGKVFLVGTAHFSKESQNDVVTVVQGVQPDVVVLELCKSRTNILQMDEETILSESQKLTTQNMVLTFETNF